MILSTTNQVELNVYIEGRSSYMKINQKDLTGLLPLGPQSPMNYMQQQQGGEYPQAVIPATKMVTYNTRFLKLNP